MKRLHVVSWNILAPIYMKCHYYSSTSCPNLSIQSRRPKIHHMIEWMNADVYLLQEVTQTEFKKLRMLYPNYDWFFQPHAFHYWKESSHHEWNGNAIAIKKTTGIQQLKKHSLRLSKGNRGLLVKGVLDGKHVSFVSIHLDDISDKCRNLQMDQLFNLIHPKSLLVIGGDLNDEFGNVIKTFQDHGFRTSPSKPTYFEERPMALDYLMVLHLKHQPFWYIPSSNRTENISTFGSDHLPITGVLRIN